MSKPQYWLADGRNVDRFGTIWEVKLLDGPHSSPKGVSESKQIIQGIGLDKGLNRNYVMVCVSEVPDIKVKLNKQAIEINKQVVEKYHNKQNEATKRG